MLVRWLLTLVILDISGQFHYAHTQIGWKHESTNDGELNEFYINNYESSYSVITDSDQIAYNYHLKQQEHHHLYQQPQPQQQQLQSLQQQEHHHPYPQPQLQLQPQQQQQQQLQSLQQQEHHHLYSQPQQQLQPLQQKQHQHYHHHHEYHHHHFEQHIIYSRPLNDDHYHHMMINSYQHQYQNRPPGSCDSQNPSILMQSNLEQPSCMASSPSDHPNDAGSSRNVPNLSPLTNKPSQNSNIESYPLATQHFHHDSSLISAIEHHWKAVGGLCFVAAILLNWLFVVIKRRFSGLTRAENVFETLQRSTNSRSVSKDTNNSSAQDSAFEELASPTSLDDIDLSKSSSDHRDKSAISVQAMNTLSVITRQRSSTLKAEPIPIPTSPGHNSPLSTSLSNSLNTSEYNSRYSSDFDSIQRLGRGGFGIVFEARNKIDDCHYAVKRICLPLGKEARERVMREVRALAKLDHAGIVRYYNAWLETPPDEWLKQHDAQLGIVHSKDGMSFPSTDGIYERNESELNTRGASGGKMGESGDNSSGLFFANGPYRRRPSGLRRLLKNNSSSPSLDIVFEGSGSIRLESENNTEKTNSNEDDGESGEQKLRLRKGKIGDNNSDSEEDSDFIQFESRSNNISANGILNGLDDLSIASHLTEPFSSSDSEAEENESNPRDGKPSGRPVDFERKNALSYQKEMRQLNNASLIDNLQVEKVYLYIQMQLCRKDTLKDWLKTNCEHRDKTTIFDLFYQIVDAVEYVHSQDLIHRDLKPSNIFFSLDGTLKIGDFGLCRAKTSVGIGSSLDLQEYVAESDAERSFEAVHTEQVGTQLYMSPEQLNGLSYNQKVDIFAMGLILLELLIPFKTQMQRVNVLFKARNNLYSDEFKLEHSQEYELVKTLLSRSPQKRPTATEIKQHELLASAQLSQPVIERIYHRRRTISSNSSTE